MSHKWFDIGLQLDIPSFQLKIIKTDTTGAVQQLQAMVDYWLNNATVPSWKVLVDTLKAPAVGESRLAKELEERYCSPEDQSSLGESEAISVTKTTCSEEWCVSDMCTPPMQLIRAVSTLAWQKV